MNGELKNGVEKKKPKKSNLFLAIMAVLLLMSVSINMFSLLRNNEPIRLPKLGGGSSGIYKNYGPLDFTVNLTDKGQRRYLKVTMTLAYEQKGVAKELEQRKPQLRDLIIGVLRAKTADDVSSDEIKEQLRDELVQQINAVLTRGQIADIYFIDFLVQ